MADVDLSVAVTSTGVPAAIENVRALRKEGLSTATALTQLAGASRAAMQNIGNTSAAARASGQSVNGFRTAITATGKEAVSLTQQLRMLEQGYKNIAREAPLASAAQKIAMFGGKGGFEAGMANVATMTALRAALNPDAYADATMAAQMRAQRAAAISAQQDAKVANARAREDMELQARGATTLEQAKVRLTRATQDLARAEAARLATGIGVANTARTAALNAETAAMRELTMARRQLASAEAQGQPRSSGNAFQQSYSYFIVAGLATQAASAIREMGTAAFTASSEIERSFADVRRTTEGTASQLGSLRDHLMSLSTATPVSFIDLAEIATLGNQLGIAAEDIENFTTVMAQYTAVSGQSAENAATAFGRISNLTGLAASEYSNLASSITYVARTSVATESTIQNTAKEITALAAGAGFSADSIVGLAGALSSLAIPPERARGALSLYFGALNSAVSEGGPKMEAFATVTNKTAGELERMVRENRGQEVFTSFISGLSELDTVAKSSALDELGLSTIRVDQTMRALSQNVPLLTSSFEGANRAFRENVEIGNQYAIIQDTLDAKWKMFQNSVQNAAAAMGDEFASAGKTVLVMLTELLKSLSALTETPLGKAFVTFIGFAATLVGAIAAIVGVAALAKASLVVLSFAVEGFGWSTAMAGWRGWLANLFSVDKANRVAARSMTGLKVAFAETTAGMSAATVGARVLSGALHLLKIAWPIAAITAGIALYQGLEDAIKKAIDPSLRLTDNISGLKDALVADNPNIFNRAMNAVAESTKKTTAEVSPFNAALLSAIEIQKRAEGAFKDTTGAIDAQGFAIGENTKKWIAETLKGQEDIADILDGREWGEAAWEGFWGFVTESRISADAIISRDDFEKLIKGGMDINQLSQIALTSGKDAAMASYNAWRRGWEAENPDSDIAEVFGRQILGDVLDSVLSAADKAMVEAAMEGAGADAAKMIALTAEEFNNLDGEMVQISDSGEVVIATFTGVKSALSGLQDGLQTAMKGFVDFKEIYKSVEEDAKNAAKEAKDDSLVEKLVNVDSFGKKLDQANEKAVTFFNGVTELARSGHTSFATQLSALGPDAEDILAESLDLSPEAQGRLEAAARFAAFLASDAFKKVLDEQANNWDEAYAQILRGGGTLAEVQDFIASQIAGPEASRKWEELWAINHPEFPLNLDLKYPSPEELQLLSDKMDGKIQVKVEPIFESGVQSGTANTYKDTKTGASITLPANLDGKALTASLEIWRQNQSATPEQIAAKLNKDEMNKDLDLWRKTHGNVTIHARVIPQMDPLPRLGYPSILPRIAQQGGHVAKAPRYASGGRTHGQITGPGSGTSDSIWARVSNNEYINTAASRKFWGNDFFDSLNRKMLPTSFLNMLGAAAVSGNRGPQQVTNVEIVQNNPLTRDPLKQLREDSEMVATGIWG